MAHSLTAKKRIRQNERRQKINRMRKNSMRTQIKKFLKMTKETKDLTELEKELVLTQKKIDQTVAKGTVHKNFAARKKSQLYREFNTVKAKAQ